MYGICVGDEKDENSHLSLQAFLVKVHCSHRVLHFHLRFGAPPPLFFFFGKGFFLIPSLHVTISAGDSKHSARIIFYIIYIIRKVTGYNGAVMTH